MSDLSKFLKRHLGVPEINLRTISSPGVDGEKIVETLSEETARAVVTALDDTGFAALVRAVQERKEKETR